MRDKYLNEAIIGNENMLSTYSLKGELLRLCDLSKDCRQYVDFFHTGIKVNDSDLIYLHDDINNVYEQYYEEDANILNTEIINTYFNIKVKQIDYFLQKENVLCRKYIFENNNKIDLNISFYVHSQLLSDINNFVGCKITNSGMIQYAHDFSVSTFSTKSDIIKHQINGSSDRIKRTEIFDKDYIGMSKDSSVAYDIGVLKPNDVKEIEICISVGKNENISIIEDEIERLKKLDFEKEFKTVKTYWKNYIKEHNTLKIKKEDSEYNKKIYDIYIRSILLFPLLTNKETGGMIAAPEVDENFNNCGRYAYCWPRDAVFITKAMDILKMTKETDRFYNVFCKKVQSKNGMFEQRFFTDGKLAPCWGYQIDETASIIYGVYEHYKEIKKSTFLKENLSMCEKANEFLMLYVDDILNNKNNIHVSYDLWEMCEGVHLYSLASIYSAFECMKKIYEASGSEKIKSKSEKISKIKKEINQLQIKIKKYIEEQLYDNEKNSYIRNVQDKKIDISLLGMVVPFGLYESKDNKIKNTVERIELSLRTYTGGYKRFEDDNYMKGNPWVISNLWMALYYIEAGERNKALESFDFVLKTVGKHNILSEQIDNETMKPNWVMGLGWSHAMFIIVIEKLFK